MGTKISEETARLAAKWWRNRFESAFTKIVGNNDTSRINYHIEALEIAFIKSFAESSLEKLDEFENDLYNEILRFKKCKHLCLSSACGKKFIIGKLMSKYDFILFPRAETWISNNKIYYKIMDDMLQSRVLIITSPDTV